MSRRKPPADKPGEEREMPSGITLPKLTEVHESEWDTKNPPFDKHTALRIINAGSIEDGENATTDENIYDFYINMDNHYLNYAFKTSRQPPEIVRARFKYGMVLIGLALIREDSESRERPTKEDTSNTDEGPNGNIEDKVDQVTKAIAPVLLPIIDSLGSLDVEDEQSSQASGEAT
jgi:hypothetical protein